MQQQLMIPIALHIVIKNTWEKITCNKFIAFLCFNCLFTILTIKNKMNEKIITEVQIVQIQGEHKFFR